MWRSTGYLATRTVLIITCRWRGSAQRNVIKETTNKRRWKTSFSVSNVFCGFCCPVSLVVLVMSSVSVEHLCVFCCVFMVVCVSAGVFLVILSPVSCVFHWWRHLTPWSVCVSLLLSRVSLCLSFHLCGHFLSLWYFCVSVGILFCLQCVCRCLLQLNQSVLLNSPSTGLKTKGNKTFLRVLFDLYNRNRTETWMWWTDVLPQGGGQALHVDLIQIKARTEENVQHRILST